MIHLFPSVIACGCFGLHSARRNQLRACQGWVRFAWGQGAEARLCTFHLFYVENFPFFCDLFGGWGGLGLAWLKTGWGWDLLGEG